MLASYSVTLKKLSKSAAYVKITGKVELKSQVGGGEGLV